MWAPLPPGRGWEFQPYPISINVQHGLAKTRLWPIAGLGTYEGEVQPDGAHVAAQQLVVCLEPLRSAHITAQFREPRAGT